MGSSTERLIIEGGHRLHGEAPLQKAKNFALQAAAAALLTDEDVTIVGMPDIQDVHSTLSIQKSLGVNISGDFKTGLVFNARDINYVDIDPAIAEKTTGSRYYIPVLAKRFGGLISGPSGGDRLGGDDRYTIQDPVKKMYEQMGIGISEYNSPDGYERYHFFETESTGSIKLEERFFGPTVQSLLARALDQSERTFDIFKPSVEPEVFATMDLLNSMGADISYSGEGAEDGQDVLHIKGVKKLHGTKFNVMSDPNALVSYAAAALATDGEVVLTGVDPTDKVAGFINLLNDMNADFSYDPDSKVFVVMPSLSRLRPLHLSVDFWPSYCHTDWHQILTPVLAQTERISIIHENVTKERFQQIPALAKMGGRFEYIGYTGGLTREAFKTDGLFHSLYIHGGDKFKGAQVDETDDIRGSTAILIAGLAASGITEMTGTYQLDRGLENADEVLNSLGANIVRAA